MPTGARSRAEKIMNHIVNLMENNTSAKVVTRDVNKVRPFDDDFNRFPAIWVGRGNEDVFDTEHSLSLIMDLNVKLMVFVQDPDKVHDKVERMIQAIDNAMLRDLDKNEFAILTKLSGIDEPDYFDMKGWTTLNYIVRYQYTQGDR